MKASHSRKNTNDIVINYERARDDGLSVYFGPHSRGITFVASKFAVVSFLYTGIVPSMLFQRNNSEFRGEKRH